MRPLERSGGGCFWRGRRLHRAVVEVRGNTRRGVWEYLVAIPGETREGLSSVVAGIATYARAESSSNLVSLSVISSSSSGSLTKKNVFFRSCWSRPARRLRPVRQGRAGPSV